MRGEPTTSTRAAAPGDQQKSPAKSAGSDRTAVDQCRSAARGRTASARAANDREQGSLLRAYSSVYESTHRAPGHGGPQSATRLPLKPISNKSSLSQGRSGYSFCRQSTDLVAEIIGSRRSVRGYAAKQSAIGYWQRQRSPPLGCVWLITK